MYKKQSTFHDLQTHKMVVRACEESLEQFYSVSTCTGEKVTKFSQISVKDILSQDDVDISLPVDCKY